MGKRVPITQKELQSISKKSHKAQAISYMAITAMEFGCSIGLVCAFSDVFNGGIAFVLFLPGILCAFIGIYHLIIAISEASNKKDYMENLLKSDMATIDQMDGVTFENYLESLFGRMGYRVKTTKKSKDFGVDLILECDHKIIVQAKRYKNKVSISSVQEICAARNYYNVSEAWVITNSFFTQSAISLAQSNKVRLIDRVELAKIIASWREKND